MAEARKLGKGPRAVTVEPVADGVWVVRGGFPKRLMNVYLLEDDGGVTVFDAGIHDMVKGIRLAADELGGIKRVVLGHAHEDHRGAAADLGAPVYCHEAEKRYAEDPLDPHTDYFDLSKIEPRLVRFLMPRFLKLWNGPPCRIEGTVAEGDEIAGFRVLHLPGHAPGLIGLWRESDHLALVSDTFYTIDVMKVTSPAVPPQVPHRAYNLDTEQARASVRKVAELDPAVAWAGHAEPVRGDVGGQLERAAAGT